MIYLIKQIWPCLLIAGLIGLIFGWLLKRVCKKRSDYDSALNLDIENKEIVIPKTKLGGIDSSQQELELMKAKVSSLEFSLKESERKSLLLDDKEADIELKHKKIQELTIESNNKDQEIKLLKGRLNNADLNLNVKKDAQAQTFIGTSSTNMEELDSTIKAIKPKFLKQADNGVSDNLQLIKGVGVKLNKVLNELGVFHFYQIASWKEKEVAWVNNYLAFSGRIQRDEWIKQAKLLKEGKETDFSKRVKKGEISTSKHKT